MLFSRIHKKKATASHIVVTGNGIAIGRAGEQCRFSVHSPGTDRMFANHCSVAFEGPSKPEIRFSTKNERDVECSWIPRLPGIYKVFVRYNSQEVPGSPFSCRIEGGEQLHETHRSRICCKGRALQFGALNVHNEVFIEEVSSIIGGISVSMEGPGKPDIQFQQEEQGLVVLYKCTVPGLYTLNIKFANDHINGSPFQIRVQ